jgi:hypothetical protein
VVKPMSRKFANSMKIRPISTELNKRSDGIY